MSLFASVSIKELVHSVLAVLKLVDDLSAEVGIVGPQAHSAVFVDCLRLPMRAQVPVATIAVRVRCHIY